MAKCNKTHPMGTVWEIGTLTFLKILVTFFHQIPIPWYTSLHGNSMDFLIKFSYHENILQNPFYRRPGIQIPGSNLGQIAS